jgi:signal transduction histidine kinase/DNA-binding NarL/FixJ family response regulator
MQSASAGRSPRLPCRLWHSVPALTVRADISIPGAPAAFRAFRLQLPRHLRDPDLAVPVAFGLILLATAFEVLMLALEITLGGDDRSFHLLALVGLMVIFVAVLASCYFLRRRIEQLAQLSARLEAALRAKEAAEIANLAKARYLANVSHEIRSPLNAIYGYAQLVEQKADIAPHDAARVIRRCAEHMTSLVESLLDISRLENGLLRVRSEIVRLPDFLEQIVWMMRPAAEAKGLTFVHEPPARLPEFVRTDPARLRQALINLIGNAIKFTDEGSVTLRIAYRSQVATLEIEDTGPGIAAEDQQRILDPYEQVAGSGGKSRQGVGLGLPITKAIIEILGGKLELESAPGRGSCFRVTLMLSEPANALAPEAPRRRIVGHEGPRRSILVVDDDPDQRDFLERFLASCGFEVVALPNGETAVTLCSSRGFDLAVLDISLPGMSGWETAARIRDALGQEIVIVMASANAQEFHRPEYHQPTHDHFFVKPYRLDKMAEAIAALLHLSWKWEATGSAAEPAEPHEAGLPLAAARHVEQLRERIQIGHVRGIEAEIAMLADAAPGHGHLVSALYAALDEFDLAGMAKLLERI